MVPSLPGKGKKRSRPLPKGAGYSPERGCVESITAWPRCLVLQDRFILVLWHGLDLLVMSKQPAHAKQKGKVSKLKKLIEILVHAKHLNFIDLYRLLSSGGHSAADVHSENFLLSKF